MQDAAHREEVDGLRERLGTALAELAAAKEKLQEVSLELGYARNDVEHHKGRFEDQVMRADSHERQSSAHEESSQEYIRMIHTRAVARKAQLAAAAAIAEDGEDSDDDGGPSQSPATAPLTLPLPSPASGGDGSTLQEVFELEQTIEDLQTDLDKARRELSKEKSTVAAVTTEMEVLAAQNLELQASCLVLQRKLEAASQQLEIAQSTIAVLSSTADRTQPPRTDADGDGDGDGDNDPESPAMGMYPMPGTPFDSQARFERRSERHATATGLVHELEGLLGDSRGTGEAERTAAAARLAAAEADAIRHAERAADLTVQLNRLRDELDRCNVTVDELRAEQRRLRDEAEARLTRALDAQLQVGVHQQAAAAAAVTNARQHDELVVLRTRLLEAQANSAQAGDNDELAVLQAELDATRAQLEVVHSPPAQHDGELAALRSALEAAQALHSPRAQIADDLATLRAEVEATRSQLEAMRASRAQHDDELAALRAALEAAQALHSPEVQANDDSAALHAELEATRAQLEAMRASRAQHDDELAALRAALEAAQALHSPGVQANDDSAALHAELEATRAQLEAMHASRAQHDDELAALRAALEAVRSAPSQLEVAHSPTHATADLPSDTGDATHCLGGSVVGNNRGSVVEQTGVDGACSSAEAAASSGMQNVTESALQTSQAGAAISVGTTQITVESSDDMVGQIVDQIRSELAEPFAELARELEEERAANKTRSEATSAAVTVGTTQITVEASGHMVGQIVDQIRSELAAPFEELAHELDVERGGDKARIDELVATVHSLTQGKLQDAADAEAARAAAAEAARQEQLVLSQWMPPEQLSKALLTARTLLKQQTAELRQLGKRQFDQYETERTLRRELELRARVQQGLLREVERLKSVVAKGGGRRLVKRITIPPQPVHAESWPPGAAMDELVPRHASTRHASTTVNATPTSPQNGAPGYSRDNGTRSSGQPSNSTVVTRGRAGGTDYMRVEGVWVVPSRASSYLGLDVDTARYALVISSTGVRLEDEDSGDEIISWSYRHLARKGEKGGLISLESTNSSRRIPGVYHLGLGEQAEEVFRELQLAHQRARPRN
jgi:hypothetical protein